MGGVLASLILVWLLFIAFARADTSSPWLLPSSISLQKQADLSGPPPSINGNIDCFLENNAVCAINTLYGTANTSASVKLANTSDYRAVVSYIDNHQHFMAIPGSNTVITYTAEPPYGFYMYFNYNFSSSITQIDSNLESYYQINRPPDGKLADRDNHRLAADYVSISFSENGQWMVVSEPNVATLRVNLQTFEVLPFAPGFNYAIGLNPAPQTSITNDGRYAVVASKDFNRFNIYDLSTCGVVPTTITGPVTCQSRDLQSFMSQGVNGFTNASNLRFISNDTLGLYASYKQNSTDRIAKYILSTATGAVHQQDYLALGDSYISGEGAFQYLQGTDTAYNQCHVSLVSYPYLLGQELNFNAYHSIACSGATTNDIINTSETYDGQLIYKAQKQKYSETELDLILTNFQQGYIDQLDFVKQYQPRAITISIGGNDIGFSSRLRSCLGTGTCYSTYEDRLEFVREVNRAFPKLVSTYSGLKNTGAPDARIYAVGYPQIAKPDGNCAVNVHLNHDELLFTQQAIDYLDNIIKAAAAKAGVFYIDTQDAFYRHRLCEADPGSVAMNGITAGNDFPDILGGPIGRESYHPNVFGHQLLENKALSSTNNLRYIMPEPNLMAIPPAETSLEILNAPHSGRAVNVTEFDPDISADLAYQQVPIEFIVNGAGHSLQPNSTLQAEIHSIPISLGGYLTDSNGGLSGQITVPASIPAGYHTLHFYGTDIAGQQVDIFKVIYVASTADDLDGDSVADSTQKCVGILPSGQDYDQDNLDDACDGTIGQLPIPSSPANISGSLSSGSGGLSVSTGISSSADSANNNEGRRVANNPVVLGTNTSDPQPKIAQASELRIPTRYYIGSILSLMFISSLVLGFKRWAGKI